MQIRHFLRLLYYAMVGLLSTLSMSLFGAVVCWLVLGMLINPPKLIPYVVALVTMTSVALGAWAKASRLRERAESTIRHRLKVFCQIRCRFRFWFRSRFIPLPGGPSLPDITLKTEI